MTFWTPASVGGLDKKGRIRNDQMGSVEKILRYRQGLVYTSTRPVQQSFFGILGGIEIALS